MDDLVLRTHQLTKTFRGQQALRQVDMTIRRGSIYGFIGQNGAGKSTLIRLVTGLAAPTSGAVELFGKSGERELTEARKRVGSIIEGPGLYLHMTAEQNMEAHRLLKGIPGKECIRKALDAVGLQDAGRKKAKNLSLGMKQRLGLAIALLGEPEFLILDEPINGLDPMGVMEIRELLQRLNREYGTTILISSHILSELHLLATHYGFIHQGRLIEQLTATELNEKCRQFMYVKVDNPARAAVLLETVLGTRDFEVLPDGGIRLYQYLDAPGKVGSALAAEGLVIEQLMPMGESLEQYFTSLIRGEPHDRSPENSRVQTAQRKEIR